MDWNRVFKPPDSIWALHGSRERGCVERDETWLLTAQLQSVKSGHKSRRRPCNTCKDEGAIYAYAKVDSRNNNPGSYSVRTFTFMDGRMLMSPF